MQGLMGDSQSQESRPTVHHSPLTTHHSPPYNEWMTEEPTSAVQDYLKAIHSLGGAEHVVTPVEIAARLQVRSPSVTGMLKRLGEAGWINYEVGRGAQLTEEGIAQARRVIRRHRLVELF